MLRRADRGQERQVPCRGNRQTAPSGFSRTKQWGARVDEERGDVRQGLLHGVHLDGVIDVGLFSVSPHGDVPIPAHRGLAIVNKSSPGPTNRL